MIEQPNDFSTSGFIIEHTVDEEILSDPKMTFLKKINNMQDPSILEICNAYNEKISELFDENIKSANALKKLMKVEEKNDAMEKKIHMLNQAIKEKNENITTLNMIFNKKINEISGENEKLKEKNRELVQRLHAQESLVDTLHNEEMRLTTILSSQEEVITNELKKKKGRRSTGDFSEKISQLVNVEQVNNEIIVEDKIKNLTKEKEKGNLLRSTLTSASNEIQTVKNERKFWEEQFKIQDKELAELLTSFDTGTIYHTGEQNRIAINGIFEEYKKETENILSELEIQNKNLMDQCEQYEKKSQEKGQSNIEEQKLKLQIEERANALNESQRKNDELVCELIVDLISSTYIQENSIILHTVVDAILSNFQLYLNTSFIPRKISSAPLSMMNDFLEDLFFRIYDICQSHNHDDLTQDLIQNLSSQIYHKNTLIPMKKSQPIEKIIEMFTRKYENLFKSTHEILKDDTIIWNKIHKKLDEDKRNLISQLESLIHHAGNYIKSGKIFSNSKEIYNFQRYPMGENMKNSNSFKNGELEIVITDHMLMTDDALDAIISFIRNEESDMSIHLNGEFKNEQATAVLSRILWSMLLNSQKCRGIVITKCDLDRSLLRQLSQVIEHSTNLKHLELTDCNLGDELFKHITESLKINKTIESFKFNGDSLSTNGGFYLAEALLKNSQITNLDIGNNSINQTGMSALLTVLANNTPTLICLDISNNGLTCEDFEFLSDLLKKNHPLARLSIAFNNIDPQSANFLGIGILYSKNLKEFNITNTSLNEESAALLLKHLNESQIDRLIMDNNPLNEVGAILFASIIKLNTVLKSVSLRKCNISSLGFSCLAKALHHNTVLEGFNLELNEFDEAGLLLFCGLMKNKTVVVTLTEELISPKVKDAIMLLKNVILK